MGVITMNEAASGVFCYTVSENGTIEAYAGSAEERVDCSREFYTAEAAVKLAIQRAEAFLEAADVGITAGDRIRKYLGRLKENPDAVLEQARANA